MLLISLLVMFYRHPYMHRLKWAFIKVLISVSFMLNTMDVLKVTLFFTCAVVLFGESCCEECNNDLTSKSAAVRLSSDLFCSYNTDIRPVMNQSAQINVNTSFYIFNVHMNEEWDYLQMNIQLLMIWKDEFLVWDSSKYENIENVYRDSTTIWVPHFMSYDMGFSNNNAEFSYFLPRSMVKINNKGIVKYSHRLAITAQCSTNIAKWPFDSHNCTMFIGSPLYTNRDVNYTFPYGYYNLDYYNSDREWKVNTIEKKCTHISYVKSNTSYTHCVLQYDINIERFSTMYYSSVIIPAIVLSMMRNFTFLMGQEVFLRIILLCLFFISELLYLQFLNMKIPNNGVHDVYIVQLYSNSAILTALAITINVINNRLYKRGTEDFPCNAPEWLKSTMKFLLTKKPITIITNFNTEGAELLIEKNMEEDNPNSQRDENASLWKTLSILLDRLFFITILIISLINFLFLIP